jgi:hypothetical protein
MQPGLDFAFVRGWRPMSASKQPPGGPQQPDPPGGRARERLRQFERERGLDPSEVGPSAADEDEPAPDDDNHD